MTDITKCFGIGCPVRKTCYRYTSPDRATEIWQSWFAEVPGKLDRTLQPEGVWVCEMHVPVQDRDAS